MKTRSRFIHFALPVAALALAPPGTCWDGDKPSIVLDVPQADGTLSWEGKPGRTYFVQHSDDLLHWLHQPEIWSGDGTALSAFFECSAPRLFLRLHATDAPTTDPATTDFDHDGLGSWTELDPEGDFGTDPLHPDTDRDGLPDGLEHFFYSTDPLASDSDGDGVSDGDEVNVHFSNPNAPDSDGDGLSDGAELAAHTDLWRIDSDGDGWTDAYELNTPNTSPINIDTDHDGIPDPEDGSPTTPGATAPPPTSGLVVWTTLEFTPQ